MAVPFVKCGGYIGEVQRYTFNYAVLPSIIPCTPVTQTLNAPQKDSVKNDVKYWAYTFDAKELLDEKKSCETYCTSCTCCSNPISCTCSVPASWSPDYSAFTLKPPQGICLPQNASPDCSCSSSSSSSTSSTG